MAIDTVEKRTAVAALSLAHFFGPGVTPNSSKDVEWRQESGYGYPGILPQGAIAAVDTSWRPIRRRRRF